MLRSGVRAASSCTRRTGGLLVLVDSLPATRNGKAVARSTPQRPGPSIHNRTLTTHTPLRSADTILEPHHASQSSLNESEAAPSSSDTGPSSASSSSSSSTFTPRQHFPLPTTTPSWYAGHMARAIRSVPSLLARYPPPLVIEARDARLPLTSINPVFESLLKKAPTANDGLDTSSSGKGVDAMTWRSRRLIVYLKRDLISPALEGPVLEALREHDPHTHVLFVDTRSDADIRKVLGWVNRQAKAIDATPSFTPRVLSERQEKRAKKGLSGAFRHTMTPEEGVRLLILGMPNVGKSSLLNGLRRVGVGKGKAASTAPTPGWTRKLMGTVRISKAGPSKVEPESVPVGKGRRSRRAEEQEEVADGSFTITAQPTEGSDGDPPIYVYDTPGVMVPFLGHGASGSERGLKLAITAGIKESLFDVQLLTDYLLFRLNLRPSSSSENLPSYVRNLPIPRQEYLASCDDPHGRTNSIGELLWHLAGKAPGSLKKGNVRDLDAAATFFLQHWRLGRVDANTELDLNTTDSGEIQRKIAEFFRGGMQVDAGKGRREGSQEEGGGGSKTQVRKQQRKQDVLARKRKLMDKGITVGAKKTGSRPSVRRGTKKRTK